LIALNSHLLDDDAEHKVSNYDRKWNSMRIRFQEDMLRILRGNQEADRLAMEMQEEDVGCLGMQVNDTAVKWVIANRQTFWNTIPDFIEWWNDRQTEIYIQKYQEFRWAKDNVDVEATRQLHASLKYDNMMTQNWSYKMNYNKIKSRKAVNENKMMQYCTPNLERYAELQCPAGCQIEEDVDHIVQCSRTRNIARELPRQILHIINKYTQRNVRFFPSFYWLWNRISYHNRLDSNFLGHDPRLAWFGIVPEGLRAALKDVGVEAGQIQECTEEIMAAITENMFRRWRKRCQHLFA